MDWFRKLYEGRESFDHQEEERAYREKQRAFTRPEVEDLCRLLALPSGARILDAYCGNGRHAIELARRGFELVGVDICMSRIVFARNWVSAEGVRAFFLVGDTRALCLRGTFEAVLILGGSFAHCLEWDENVALLRMLRSVLGSGGLLLIDNPNPRRLWRIQHREGSAAEQLAIPFFDLPLGRADSFGYVRYYCVEEMRRLLEESGLQLMRIYGDRRGGPYGIDSPRLVVIGQRGPRRDCDRNGH